MDTRTQERVNGWDSRSFSGGYERLRDLSDREFSGAVQTARTWLFMLNGRIVGLFDGTIEDFEDGEGTVFEAPDPALPLLFAMKEKGGEVQAKYYTEDTPVSEADSTLSSGSFTGYIELSENVLSGDYFVVYYGGRSMAAAFVGNSEKLLTGDEAFDRADGEVGIYEVRNVDIEVTEIPAPSEPEEADDAGSGGAVAVGVDATADDPGGSRDAGTGETPSPDHATDAPSSEDATAAPSGDPPTSGDGRRESTPAATGARTEAADDRADARESTASGDPDTAPAADRQSGETTTPPEATEESVAGETPPPATDPGTAEERSRVEDRTPDEASETDDAAADDTTVDERASAADRVEEHADPTGRDGSTDAVEGGEPGRGQAVDLDEVAEELDLMMDEPGETDAGASGDAAPGVASEDDTTEGGAPSPEYESEKEWRRTRTIPSLNPDETEDDGAVGAERADRGGVGSGGRQRSSSGSSGQGDRSRRTEQSGRGGRSEGTNRGQSSSSRSASSAGAPTGTSTSESGRTDAGGTEDDETLGQDAREREETIDRLKRELRELETERDDLREAREALRDRVASLESERDALAEENEELTAEVDRLEAEVADLEREVRDLESTLEDLQGAAATASRELTTQEALAGTNLFVRYDSKSEATLEDAHAGDADPSDVGDNLRLEYHTQFDTEDVSVEGRLFDEFLYSTMEYQFVDWAVNKLLFEVRDSGNAGAVRPLYDAVPQIDRAELHGEVDLASADGDQQGTHVFDVVLRDRMGNPLIAVELNDSRDPATQEMMVSLNEAATGAKHASDQLAAAFMVTASFFQPDALETASEATSGSLLSRDSRRSFVKLSRKRGYHLCLVEARDGEFHINVPEL